MVQSSMAVDSRKLEYAPGTIYAGFPSTFCFGFGGQPDSNFLASIVRQIWECFKV